MIEKAHRFGKVDCLVGIITEPDGHAHDKNIPGVLLLNSGLIHRVGPFRLYVELARKLAADRFSVLRFDLSGIGDSQMVKDSRPYNLRTIDEVQEAMNMFSKSNGVHRFVLMGVCSGARLAHQAAVLDSRVTGVVLVDGYGYRTLGYYIQYYGKRIFNLARWTSFAQRKYLDFIARLRQKLDNMQSVNDINTNVFPPRKEIKADLMKLIDRDVDLLIIYSGEVEDYYNYQHQFRQTFPTVDFRGKLQVEYFSEASHTFTLLDHRHRLTATICKWMQTHY